MNSEIYSSLASIVRKDWVIKDKEQIQTYLTDETPKGSAPRAGDDIVVVKPKNSGQISEIMKLANETGVTVVPRGAGTGLCGGAIPIENGIVLSLERLNEIIEVDEDNLMITCQAGTTLEELFAAVEKTDNLFFPPHPGDEGAQVGGLVVENAGGARALKYGVMRNYVKGVRVVLPRGKELKLGGKILKNNTGYDIMQLFIGSEGTLGIVTEVTLRLFPKSEQTSTLLVPFENRQKAMETVPQILQGGIIPLALEYVEKDLIEESAHHLGKRWPAPQGKAFLIIIFTANSEDELFNKGGKIVDICAENGSREPLFAQRRREQSDILDIRSNIYTALESETADILDVTVPPACTGELLDSIDELARRYGTRIPVYGHAGDGNVHPHVMNVDGGPPPYLEELKEDIYNKAIELGGVITGEHGIGRTRVKNLSLMFDKQEIELMKELKSVFDPNGVLNPGKVVPR